MKTMEVIDELKKRGYKAETKVISKNGIEKSGIIIGEGTSHGVS